MGELGVTEFTRAALKLGWIVRRQHESDQGIDAQVEKVTSVTRGNGSLREQATGRLIAVQIKGGRSWFRAATASGWWFSFSERERNLWINHALPVVVAMYHPEHDKVYWQRIGPTTITKAKTKYRVEVPASQTIDTAGPVWDELASGHERRAVDVFELSLQGVPPDLARALRERSESEHPDAALLAMHLAEGRKNPLGTATALLNARPRWITENGSWAWGLVGQYCSAHDLMSLAADAFELSSDANSDNVRIRSLVAAATHRMSDDIDAARELMRRADESDSEPVIRAVGRTIVAGTNERGAWTLDPLLLAGGAEVDESAAAQRILCGQARVEERFDDAVRHAEAARVTDPLASETMVMTAESLLARWSLGGAATLDLERSIDLLHQALEQRTKWAGKVDYIRYGLVRANGMGGDFEAVLRLALPFPSGDAIADALDLRSVRLAAYAARRVGDSVALDQAVNLLGDQPEDRLAKIRCGALDVSKDEENELRLAALDAAELERDYNEIGQNCLALCADGVDVTDRLRAHVQSGVLPEPLLVLCQAIVTIPTNGLDSSLPAMRELARTDTIAAEYLLGNLIETKRFAEAAEQANLLFELTNAAPYLLHQARALIGMKKYDAASEVARRAVAVNDIRSTDRAEMLDFLGQFAGENEDWGLAETYFSQAIDLHTHPGPTLVWNLVACQVEQGRITRASQTLVQHNPPVRDHRDAGLWMRANNAGAWDERTAFEAFALAQRFADDPQLSTALVGAIVTRTHGVGGPGEDEDDDLLDRRRAAQNAVPGELHRQAFEFIRELVARHGDKTGIRVLDAKDDDTLVEQMIEQLKHAAAADESKREIAQSVREGKIPVGLLAGAIGRGAATLEAQRAVGIRLAASQFDDEHQVEVETARSALNTSVIVDSATVITLTALASPDALTGEFVALRTAPATMLDLHRFCDDVRGMAGSPGSMRWDDLLGGVIMTELSDDEFMRLLKRSDGVRQYIDRLTVRTPGKSTIYTELKDAEQHAVWIDPLQLAIDEDASLWSDDLGLRRAARAVGIRAFGTPSLLDALRDKGIEAAGEDQNAIERVLEGAISTIKELAADHIVDLPIPPEEVFALAEEQDWNANSAAAVVLSRGSFWEWTQGALSLLQVIYGEAREHAPDSLAGWQLAAMFGAASSRQPEAAASVLAVLALVAFGGDPGDHDRAESLRRARLVATDLGVPDPAGGLPRAAALLAEGGACKDPDELVRRILDLLANDPGSTNSEGVA